MYLISHMKKKYKLINIFRLPLYDIYIFSSYCGFMMKINQNDESLDVVSFYLLFSLYLSVRTYYFSVINPTGTCNNVTKNNSISTNANAVAHHSFNDTPTLINYMVIKKMHDVPLRAAVKDVSSLKSQICTANFMNYV